MQRRRDFSYFRYQSTDDEKRYLRIQTQTLERARLAQKQRADTLEEENKKLKQENEKLKEELERVKKQRDSYKDMVFKANTVKAKASQERKRGGQIGHKGYGRKIPKNIDHYVKCYLLCCPECHTPVKRTKAVLTHTVCDLPAWEDMHPVITEYHIERQWCSQCKKEVHARPQGVVPESKLGSILLTMVLVWHYRMRLPYAKITEQLQFFYGIHVSVGSLVQMHQRTRQLLGKEYEMILKEVRGSPVVHADETSWRVNGKNWWCWTTTTEKATAYTITESRGKGVAEKLLCHAKGVLVRDDYGAYTKLPLTQQSCWAHLLRKSHEEVARDTASEEMKLLHKKLKVMFLLLGEDIAKPYHKTQRQELYSWYTKDLQKIIQTTYQQADAKRIQTRVRNQYTNLITALLHVGVPLTNNLAERAIRPLVVTRKISGGSRSVEGAKTHAVNMSIVETICKRKQPLLKTLHASLLKGSIVDN
jgi:transposase